MNWLTSLIDRLMQRLYSEPRDEEPVNMPLEAPKLPAEARETPKTIYDVSVSLLGQKLYDDLDPSVPKEVGCVQSISVVLQKSGYTIPKKGLYGVNALIDWLLENGFEEVKAPKGGAIITAHHKVKSNPAYAHAGVCGKRWIMSNDSRTGVFAANYTYGGWDNYFRVIHKTKTRYFIPKV